MGVTHKLKPEITEFILAKKKENPHLGCRALGGLIWDKFNLKISKSSCNAVIKAAGLSMPVGRRQKPKRKKPELLIKAIIAASETLPLLASEMSKPELSKQEEPVPEVPVAPEPPKEEIPPEAPPEPLPPPEPGKPVEEIPEPVEETVLPAQEPPQEVPVSVERLALELPLEAEKLGVILLKAADILLGGSETLIQAIQNQLRCHSQELRVNTNALIYSKLFDLNSSSRIPPNHALCALANSQITGEGLFSYLAKLQQLPTLARDAFRLLPGLFQEVRGLQANTSAGTVFYLDGQLHNVWSAPHIPSAFASTPYRIKNLLQRTLENSQPWIFFMAPGYNSPTQEFFDLVHTLESSVNKITRLTLYGQKLEELETLRLDDNKKRFFIMGIWLWQFGQYRKIKGMQEFRKFTFQAAEREALLTEGEITLSQPDTNQSFTLRACAIKGSAQDKVRVIIVTNLAPEQLSAEELANAYLSHWPNLDEAFEDYSRKVELFTYTATSQRFFGADQAKLTREQPPDLEGLLTLYLKVLDLYVRWHFLPAGYEERDFPTVKERFYDLSVRLEEKGRFLRVTFLPPARYSYLRDLSYACRRLNERALEYAPGKQLWFAV